jgi:hypothetical protein
MKAEVQTLYEMGRPIPAKDRKSMPKYRGKLRLNEARSGLHGRVTPTAALVAETDTTEQSVLPELHDAQVLYVRDNAMRIRGFEVCNGLEYGQVWEVQVR